MLGKAAMALVASRVSRKTTGWLFPNSRKLTQKLRGKTVLKDEISLRVSESLDFIERGDGHLKS